jgi:hypothetical protein
MPLDRRVVEASLLAKGFRKVEGDHSFFIFHDTSGRKSPVRTKTSHGTSSKQLSDSLVAAMARQCRLPIKDFKDLVNCPLSREAYEGKLAEIGAI